jgi:agmatinase
VNNFLDIRGPQSEYGNAKFVIAPFPLELTTSYMKGTALGPEAIIKASSQVETFDVELETEPWLAGIFTQEPWKKQSGESVEGFFERVGQSCFSLLQAGKVPVVIGGEHTITPVCFRGFKEYIQTRFRGQSVGLLHIDAHADLRDEYQGNLYSHACAIRRLCEPGVKVVSVGIRSLCLEEWNYLRNQPNILMIADHVWHGQSEKKGLINQMLRHLPEHVYVTVDLDGFSPDLMPAVGTPEPGGLGWYEVLDLIRTTVVQKTVHMFDVNELMPRPNLEHADFTAAKLVYKMIGYTHAAKTPPPGENRTD